MGLDKLEFVFGKVFAAEFFHIDIAFVDAAFFDDESVPFNFAIEFAACCDFEPGCGFDVSSEFACDDEAFCENVGFGFAAFADVDFALADNLTFKITFDSE